MDTLPQLTTQMAIILALVVFTVFLFATELLRVDVVAVLVMTLLGLMTFLPGFETVIDSDLLFSGLSSDAVVAIIAVMILGGGLDKTGVMERVAAMILRFGGATEKRLVALTSGTAALFSSIVQNVGVTALFIPVIAKISNQTRVPMSRLVMPMGFCAILGGTITMVGSSPLIMLNDLLRHSGGPLAAGEGLESFDLFAVAPIGLALSAAGLIYFAVVGQRLLPATTTRAPTRRAGTVRYMRRLHGMDAAIRELEVPPGSPLIGRDIRSIQREFEAKIVASHFGGKTIVSPPMEAPIAAPATLAVIAEPDDLKRFVEAGELIVRPKLKDFRYLLARAVAGIAEVVIPPDSALIGKSVRDVRLRATYGLSMLSILRAGKTITSQLQDVPLQGGDTLVCHTRWADLARLEKDRNFVVVTADYPHEPRSPYKVALALAFFAIAFGLILFTNVLLPVALMTGAVGMIVFGVLTMDEAYRAVSWKTVFLLAGLLPLGQAVDRSGAAGYIALHVVNALGSLPVWGLQAIIAVLGTGFTLIMSNVGATALLVPIAINIAHASGANPSVFALTVALAASNSFVLPTNPVTALMMGPGDYQVRDFLRAGSIMTAVFLVVSLSMLNLLY